MPGQLQATGNGTICLILCLRVGGQCAYRACRPVTALTELVL
jgi:hypothetical protein